MKNSSYSVPLGMVMRKFYCHECGERLIRHSRTRTIKQGDPEHKKYSRIGREHMIGDIELTEYDFQCPSCERITEYDEQCAIGKVQKRLRKHILLQEEIDENIDQAKTVIAKQRKIRGIAVKIVSFALAVFILYMWLRSGDFSFTLYF